MWEVVVRSLWPAKSDVKVEAEHEPTPELERGFCQVVRVSRKTPPGTIPLRFWDMQTVVPLGDEQYLCRIQLGGLPYHVWWSDFLDGYVAQVIFQEGT